jgi:RNA polymerase sigma factor (sigma-70 family)
MTLARHSPSHASFTTSPEPTPPAPASAAVRLARAASGGDVVAMDDLLRDLQPKVARVVCAVLGRSHPEVDDVCQYAMLGFVQSLDSFRGECEPVHFASRIAARTAIAWGRRTRETAKRYEDGVDIDRLTSGSTEPLANAERSRRMAVMRDALARLPVEQAEALALRIVFDWSLTEVAKATGAPLNTVRSRLRLAKHALRAIIDGDAAMRDELGEVVAEPLTLPSR